MNLCWLHGLYDAIIYIYNNGMKDFVTPTEELMSQLTSALSTGETLTTQQIDLGNKILVYISCCLAGRAYPFGDINPKEVAQVLICMFNWHFDRSFLSTKLSLS